MKRKRLTELFPFLLPLRQKQRKFLFYLKMKFDKAIYSHTKEEGLLPHLIFETHSLLINPNTGYDIRYQYNKVHNLKLAVMTMDHILIRPGETFSFWQLARYADRKERYKDGLCLVHGEIQGVYGGGLCQLSNLLYWLFQHTPLTVVEHHNHAKHSFPVPESGVPSWVDATVSEGWLDLKVKNETNATFQLDFTFDEDNLYGCILADRPVPLSEDMPDEPDQK